VRAAIGAANCGAAMRGEVGKEKRPLKLGDSVHFLRSLASTPHLTGAVAPSGRALARAMAAPVDPEIPGLVIELGPGTGPVTQALIERGLDRRRLVLVEFNPTFARMLEGRFAPACIVEGDAYDLPHTLAALDGEPVSAVVSSLPLLIQPPVKRVKLLDDAFRLMGPQGLFVQFTYGLVSPIPSAHCAGRYAARRGAPVWANLPPARVWIYRRDSSAASGPGARPARLRTIGKDKP
jgi:phosphatidylethanolamine/phosphatidyl-N-methylethanolamine N-methyltransferase